jgi:hypothetical protein
LLLQIFSKVNVSDRKKTFGNELAQTIANMGVQKILNASGSPIRPTVRVARLVMMMNDWIRQFQNS